MATTPDQNDLGQRGFLWGSWGLGETPVLSSWGGKGANNCHLHMISSLISLIITTQKNAPVACVECWEVGLVWLWLSSSLSSAIHTWIISWYQASCHHSKRFLLQALKIEDYDWYGYNCHHHCHHQSTHVWIISWYQASSCLIIAARASCGRHWRLRSTTGMVMEKPMAVRQN